jgi:hypothetical protein
MDACFRERTSPERLIRPFIGRLGHHNFCEIMEWKLLYFCNKSTWPAHGTARMNLNQGKKKKDEKV